MQLKNTAAHCNQIWYFYPRFYRYFCVRNSFIPRYSGLGCNRYGCGSCPDCPVALLDKGEVKSVRYRGPIFKTALVLFIIAFIGLGILGAMVATDTPYFGCAHSVCRLFCILPGYAVLYQLDTNKPVPDA